jgi:hypothetical protein
MTGPACKGTKVCDTDIDMKAEGQPGYTNPGGGIYVQPHASGPNRCYIGGEVQVVHRMTVNNTYKDKYVWITSTEVGKLGGQGPQINSGCINPGQQRSWIDDRYRTTGRFVRAEVMTGADCKGNKVCDTKAEVEDREVTKPVFIRQNAKDPNNCYIDWK